MVTVKDDTALGQAKERACRMSVKSPVERSTNGHLTRCERSCKNWFSKKHCKEKLQCDEIGACTGGEEGQLRRGELAELSSWFCAVSESGEFLLYS